MKGILVTLLIFMILQVAFLDSLMINQNKPDILLIVVILFGLYLAPHQALTLGLFGGLLKDISSGGPFLINTIFFASLGLVVSHISKYLYRESPFSQVFLCFLAALLNSFLYYLTLRASAPGLNFINLFKHIIFPSTLYTALLSPVLFWVFKKLRFQCLIYDET